VVKDGDIFPASLLAKGASQPALSDAAGAGDEEIAFVPDPVAGRELEKERAVEAAAAR
jgi:hypothetical protein